MLQFAAVIFDLKRSDPLLRIVEQVWWKALESAIMDPNSMNQAFDDALQQTHLLLTQEEDNGARFTFLEALPGTRCHAYPTSFH